MVNLNYYLKNELKNELYKEDIFKNKKIEQILSFVPMKFSITVRQKGGFYVDISLIFTAVGKKEKMSTY